MLIDIFSGPDRHSAQRIGSFHFSSLPSPGEQFELSGKLFTVKEAWHKPDIYYYGAKFAIFVTDTIDMRMVVRRPDNADAFA